MDKGHSEPHTVMPGGMSKVDAERILHLFDQLTPETAVELKMFTTLYSVEGKSKSESTLRDQAAGVVQFCKRFNIS